MLNELDKIAFESMTNWKEYFKNCYSKIIELFYGQMVTFIEVDNNVKSKSYNPICFFTLSIPNKKNLTMEMPNLSIYDNNVSAQTGFKYGVQMVAMCYQNFDSNLLFLLQKFRSKSKVGCLRNFGSNLN